MASDWEVTAHYSEDELLKEEEEEKTAQEQEQEQEEEEEEPIIVDDEEKEPAETSSNPVIIKPTETATPPRQARTRNAPPPPAPKKARYYRARPALARSMMNSTMAYLKQYVVAHLTEQVRRMRTLNYAFGRIWNLSTLEAGQRPCHNQQLTMALYDAIDCVTFTSFLNAHLVSGSPNGVFIRLQSYYIREIMEDERTFDLIFNNSFTG